MKNEKFNLRGYKVGTYVIGSNLQIHESLASVGMCSEHPQVSNPGGLAALVGPSLKKDRDGRWTLRFTLERVGTDREKRGKVTLRSKLSGSALRETAKIFRAKEVKFHPEGKSDGWLVIDGKLDGRP